MNLWPLLGLGVVVLGFAVRLNPVLVVALAALATRCAASADPVIENSYIFPHGTRCAEAPRRIMPAKRNIKPRIIIAVPMRPARSVREKSKVVFSVSAVFFTEKETSTAWAKNAIV